MSGINHSNHNESETLSLSPPLWVYSHEPFFRLTKILLVSLLSVFVGIHLYKANAPGPCHWLRVPGGLCVLVAQKCPTLCSPIDCSLPGSSVSGIFQARILKWLTISYPGDLLSSETEPVSLASPALASGFFTTSTTWEARIVFYTYRISKKNNIYIVSHLIFTVALKVLVLFYLL